MKSIHSSYLEFHLRQSLDIYDEWLKIEIKEGRIKMPEMKYKLLEYKK